MTIESLEKVLPWVNRSEDEWKKSISKEEATRLFYLTSLRVDHLDGRYNGHSSGNGRVHHVEDLIDRWRLRTPLIVYWDGEISAMMSDLVKFRNNETAISAREEDRDLAEAAARAFEDPQLYPYLMATRLAIRLRNGLSRTGGIIPDAFDLDKQRALFLGVEAEKLHGTQGYYQQLIEVFYPTVQKIAHSKVFKNRLLDRDDSEGVAGMGLVLAVSNFFWETMVIDPEWTSDRFLRSVHKSIWDPFLINASDTSTLEVFSAEAMARYRSPDDTEVEIISRLSEQYLKDLIKAIAPKPLETQVLDLRIFDGMSYTQIGQELGLPEDEVAKIVRRFREALRIRKEAKDGDPNIFLVPKKGLRGNPFWDNLFENIDKYKVQFEQRGAILKSCYRLALEKFFELQTGDKDTTIEAVRQSFQSSGRPVSKDTVRRAINAGINQLDHKEGDGRKYGQSLVGWSRHQQANLVAQIAQNPNIWDTFSEQRKYVLTRYFIEGGGINVKASAIAVEMGIHASTVSRIINRTVRDIYRFEGNPRYNEELWHKPRNLLPA